MFQMRTSDSVHWFQHQNPTQDALDAACQVASRSIDQLIWQAPHDVARAVTLFGPGVVVLPMLGSLGDAFTMHSSEGFLELPLYCLNLFGYCFFAAFGPSQKKSCHFRRVSGIDSKESLEYSSHPQRATGGLMDRLDLELKLLGGHHI